MAQEFEIVSQHTFRHLHVLLVQMASRTPHIHREIELGLILRGKLLVREGKQSWSVDTGEMYLINSMDAHEFMAEHEDTLILAIQISPRLFHSFVPDAALIRYQTIPPLTSAFGEFPEAYSELQNLCVTLAYNYYAQPARFEFECFAGIAQILQILSKRLPIQYIGQKDYDIARRRMDRMTELTSFIDQNYQRKLLLEELAEQQHVTLTHASHLFRDTLGITFQDYLKERRFEHALMLIDTTDRTILDISLESGFSDERYLTNLFRSRMGCSPKEYRRSRRKSDSNVYYIATSTQHILSSQEAIDELALIQNRN